MVRTERSGRGIRIICIAWAAAALMVISGCGSMKEVKMAFDANPKIAVMEFAVKTAYQEDSVIDLTVQPRTPTRISRAPEKCNVNCVIEKKPLPAEFRDIAQALHAELQTELGKSDLRYVKWSEVPSKKTSLGISAPDWAKTDYSLIIWPMITVGYDESILPTDKPYTYRLKGYVTLYLWRKNAQGDLEILRPGVSGSYQLAYVSSDLPDKSAIYLSLSTLEQLKPSTSIAKELREKSLEGVRRFVKEMKEAK
jgi:hypothetical protein